MPDSGSFSLHPATLADVPALASLAGKPNQPDRHTALKSHPKYGGYDHSATMTEPLTTWLARPATRCRVVKAIDDQTGDLLGWITWGLRGYSTDDPPLNQVSGRTQGPGDTGLARMEELTSADLIRWMNELMPPGTRCMYVISLVVALEQQGRGVGRALVRNGTDQADQDGVFCWVHASEGAAGFFERQGFEEVGRLDVDLHAFATEEDMKLGVSPGVGGSGVDGKSEGEWGMYRFRYMKRQFRRTS